MKRKGDALSGILVLDKASSQGSTQAVAKVKYLMQARKAGHGGTLDPMATGLLPILLGEATKFADDLLTADKTYRATLRLGQTTDSADAEGRVTSESPVQTTVAQVQEAILSFVGEQQQVPPMHSALKRDGKPLYEYARQGIELAIEPRTIRIDEIKDIEIDLCPHQPVAHFTVKCTKGTYIRSLARDIGTKLGCGAHLIGLRRTHVGQLQLSQLVHTIQYAVTTQELEAMDIAQRRALLLPLDSLMQSLLPVELDEIDVLRFLQGQRLKVSSMVIPMADNQTRVRVYGSNTGSSRQLLGLASLTRASPAHFTLSPLRVIQNEYS